MAIFGVKYPNRKCKPFTKEHRANIGKVQLGKKKQPFTEEHKKRISESRMGIKNWNYGKHFSEERKRKIGLANSLKSHLKGENHYNWQGGKTFEEYTVAWTKTLKRSIRERDKYTCRICNEQQGERAFSVHHIDYDKKNCDPKNLITLCMSCHLKTNHNRDYWINYFKYV